MPPEPCRSFDIFWGRTGRSAYRQFALYNIPGVLLGIGGHVVIGDFFADNDQVNLHFMQKYTVAVLVVLGVIVLLYWWKRNGCHRTIQIQ